MRPAMPFALLLVVACERSPLDLASERFVCVTHDDCIAGYACLDLGQGLECARLDALDGGVGRDGGVDAGPSGDAGSLGFDPGPDSVLTGRCVPLTLRVRDPVDAGPLDVALRLTSGTGRLSSSSTCADSLARVSLGGPRFTATVFLKPLTAGSLELEASSAVGEARAQVLVRPLVRRGVCRLPAVGPSLPDGGAGTPGPRAVCPFSPPVESLSSSFVLTQVLTSTLQVAGAGLVRCSLSSVSSLVCERYQDSDESTVHFQVAELPSGLRVHHLPPGRCEVPVRFDGGVDPARTFVVKSSTTNSNFYDDDDSPAVVLRSGAEVGTVGAQCGDFSTQLLEWRDAKVVRGFFDGGTLQSNAALGGLPVAGPNTALVVQPLTPDGVVDVCAAMLRGTLASSGELLFSRGARSDAGCPAGPMPGAYFERIDFGPQATVQQHVVVNPPGGQADVMVRPYDVTRTLLFSSAQTVAGQGAGETSLVDTRLYPAGTVAFVPLSSTRVGTLRAERTATTIQTLFVVELTP
ncbi:MAG: hypothetical protein SFW67_14605 [Myxococcaceae bacterium]|nr:hypothetical protein [Myxococcaceae bacterium]